MQRVSFDPRRHSPRMGYHTASAFVRLLCLRCAWRCPRTAPPQLCASLRGQTRSPLRRSPRSSSPRRRQTRWLRASSAGAGLAPLAGSGMAGRGGGGGRAGGKGRVGPGRGGRLPGPALRAAVRAMAPPPAALLLPALAALLAAPAAARAPPRSIGRSGRGGGVRGWEGEGHPSRVPAAPGLLPACRRRWERGAPAPLGGGSRACRHASPRPLPAASPRHPQPSPGGPGGGQRRPPALSGARC